MDRLAAGGVRFDDAHAHNVLTLPSHANLLSGRYPTDHGVRDNSGFRFPSRLATLATLLKAGGYHTGAFVSAFPLAARFGLTAGFDLYEDRFVDAQARPAFLEQQRPGSETVALAQRWIEAQGTAPFFCWLHIYEPHFPYEPPEPYASRFPGDPYHGEVATADAALGPLLEPILARGDGSHTLVVLTADHGESLGEHGEATHGIFAYEATLRVPLILYAPRLLRPRVVFEPARHVDVLPTILDALDLPVPEGLPGRSLLPVAGGASAAATTSYFEALSGQLNRGWAPLRGVIRGRRKLIDLPMVELYDLGSDPQEVKNLADSQPVRLTEMRSLLAPFRDEDQSVRRGTESAETRERLASLGYVAAGGSPGKTSYSDEDDPKRLIVLDGILQEVVSRYGAGDVSGALEKCRELVRLRPNMPLSLLSLAHLEREAGNLEAAVRALRTAAALDPEDPTTLSLLGAYLTQAGRPQEAADLLEPYARRSDPDLDLLSARGLALARLGRTQEALATFDRAREVEPENAMILVDVGTVLLLAGDGPRARAAFEQALARNPRLARAHSSLAFLAADLGRESEAREHWKQAVALDPRECEKLLALGARLARGRPAEARRYLELYLASAPPGSYAREKERVRQWLAGGAAGGL
jgi:choline-sulfatase